MALWSLAGNTFQQQKYIANTIGIQLLIELIMNKSEKLQYTGKFTVGKLCELILTLARLMLGCPSVIKFLAIGNPVLESPIAEYVGHIYNMAFTYSNAILNKAH